MNTSEYIKEQFGRLHSKGIPAGLENIRNRAFQDFSTMGIPTMRHEEWKYTRISGFFNKDYELPLSSPSRLEAEDFNGLRLPGYEEANELVFINGIFSKELSQIRSASLVVMPLEEAASGEFSNIVSTYLGDSRQYLKDGINALNTAFIDGGIFINIRRSLVVEHPVYVYNITDARQTNILSQPRTLVHIGENAHVKMVETYKTMGGADSFTNQVMEIIVEEAAMLEYYKLQNDVTNSSLVSSTHIRQVGKSHVHTVTISLDGGIVRNNLNIVMAAAHSESHLYGLYFPKGDNIIDNHTLVDNVEPNCLSNELYKGIASERGTGVFNGKIYVQQKAQKTNAYQTNKNILLSEDASVNTKPQLEIFADDVKCSHGCTVGRLDEEGLFYLRSRGISEQMAQSLMVHAFATDVLEHIRIEAIHTYVEQLISERLDFNFV